MAFTTLFMVVLLAVTASARFGDFDDTTGFNPSVMAFSSARAGAGNFPQFPSLPGFPQINFPSFPNLPQPPPLPSIPTFQDIFNQVASQAASVANVANAAVANVANAAVANPGNGQVSSILLSTSGIRGQDGTYQGGTTIVTNDNGQVTVEKHGSAPPAVEITQFQNPPFDNFDASQFKPKRPFKPFKHNFNFPTFEPFTMKPFPTIDPETYVPGKDESFQGTSFHSHSFSSNVDGVKNSGGYIKTVENDNGKITKQKVTFKK